METSELMDVVAVGELQEDKNGREFRRITVANPVFKTIVDEQTGDMKTILQPSLKASTNAYEENYLDGSKDWLANAQVGMAIEGRIERRPVESYEFTGRDGNLRIATTYTCVVFGNTKAENWEEIVKAAFRRNQHPVLGDTSVDALQTPSSVADGKVDITAGTVKKPATVSEF